MIGIIMENISNSIRGVSDLEKDLNAYTTFVSYMLANFRDAPFKLETISKDLNLPEGLVEIFFNTLKMNFDLFRSLENLKALQWEDICLSETDEHLQEISISINQLMALSDFHYLSTKKPMTIPHFNKIYKEIKGHFPMFFKKSQKGWITTSSGKHVAEQYLSFKRLNSLPKEIVYKNLKLEIDEND
jgi:hypothetical protein